MVALALLIGGRGCVQWRATAAAIVTDAEECVNLGVEVLTLPPSSCERGKEPGLPQAR